MININIVPTLYRSIRKVEIQTNKHTNKHSPQINHGEPGYYLYRNIRVKNSKNWFKICRIRKKNSFFQNSYFWKYESAESLYLKNQCLNIVHVMTGIPAIGKSEYGITHCVSCQLCFFFTQLYFVPKNNKLDKTYNMLV